MKKLIFLFLVLSLSFSAFSSERTRKWNFTDFSGHPGKLSVVGEPNGDSQGNTSFKLGSIQVKMDLDHPEGSAPDFYTGSYDHDDYFMTILDVYVRSEFARLMQELAHGEGPVATIENPVNGTCSPDADAFLMYDDGTGSLPRGFCLIPQ